MIRTLLAAFVFPLLLAAQDEPKGAKSMFHDPASVSVGLAHRLELREPDGQYLPVPEGYRFKNRDRVRLMLTSNVAGILSVLVRTEGQRYSKLFPAGREDYLAVSRGQAVPIFLTFDEKPEDVDLVFVLAKTPGAAPEWIEKVKHSSLHAAALGRYRA